MGDRVFLDGLAIRFPKLRGSGLFLRCTTQLTPEVSLRMNLEGHSVSFRKLRRRQHHPKNAAGAYDGSGGMDLGSRSHCEGVDVEARRHDAQPDDSRPGGETPCSVVGTESQRKQLGGLKQSRLVKCCRQTRSLVIGRTNFRTRSMRYRQSRTRSTMRQRKPALLA